MPTPAPGTSVTVSTAPRPATPAQPTGTAFMIGLCQRGPVGKAIGPMFNLGDFIAQCGTRQSYSILYDAADAFFQEGGGALYVGRVVGPAAVTATLTLMDKAVTPLATLVVNANGPGVWGNSISVQVVDDTSSTYHLVIYYNSLVVETSPILTSPADAVAWAAVNSAYVSITNSGSATAPPNNIPNTLAATALASGADDNASAGDTQFTTAINNISSALGPGQILAPGRTTTNTVAALVAHAASSLNNRVALIDTPDSPTASNLTAIPTAIQSGSTDPSFAATFGPWLIYPGVPTGTSTPAANRTIPPSAIAAALASKNDAKGDANQAAAGINGQLVGAIGVSQTYNNSDLTTLHQAGVNVFKNLAPIAGIQLYDYVSCAIDPNWIPLNFVRFRMQLVYEGQVIAAQYLFGKNDAKGQLLSKFNGALRGSLAVHWREGSLYGVSPSDAFSVQTGPPVNTPATQQAGQLNAIENVRMAPDAPYVNINIIKYLITQTLPASS